MLLFDLCSYSLWLLYDIEITILLNGIHKCSQHFLSNFLITIVEWFNPFNV